MCTHGHWEEEVGSPALLELSPSSGPVFDSRQKHSNTFCKLVYRMLSSLYATMHTAASVTAKLSLQSATASRHGIAHLPRVARLNHAVKARPMVRHITAMSYPQAYPEPASAPRSNRVYTGVALLEFAPAQQGSGTAPGERRYDWENKSVTAVVL